MLLSALCCARCARCAALAGYNVSEVQHDPDVRKALKAFVANITAPWGKTQTILAVWNVTRYPPPPTPAPSPAPGDSPAPAPSPMVSVRTLDTAQHSMAACMWAGMWGACSAAARRTFSPI